MNKETDNRDRTYNNQADHYSKIAPIINKPVAKNNKTTRKDNDCKTEYLLKGVWIQRYHKQKNQNK